MKKRIIPWIIIITVVVLGISAAGFYAYRNAEKLFGVGFDDMVSMLLTGKVESTEDTEASEAIENSTEQNVLDSSRTCDSYEQFASDSLILDPKYSAVRSTIYDNMEEYCLQGTVLVGVGDDIVYVESFGKASEWDDIDNTNTTRYGIASLSKSFTAAAIMQLHEEGKLDVNDTIDKYFPDYAYGSEITILELLQMRSGIIDYLNDMDEYMTVEDSKAIYEAYVENEDWKGLDEYPWTREDMLKNLYNNDLKFEPDERYAYSNTNYYLLGCIVEQASGMDYDTYITENILEPCHMSSSNLAPMEGDAIGYIRNEGFVSSSRETLFAAGGIRSNAFDMFSWMRNLSKGNIISEESFATMIDVEEVAIKNQQYYEREQERLREELGEEYEEPEVDPDFVPTYYGCGLMVTGPVVWHRGYIDGFASYMSVDMETDVTIIILTNTGEERVTKNLEELVEDIREAMDSL